MRPHKIAIIGSTGFTPTSNAYRVNCYGWDELEKMQEVNLKDYDSIIISLLLLPNPDDINWNYFYDCIDDEVMTEVLAHDGKVIVLGDPAFQVAGPFYEGTGSIYHDFLHWTGMVFSWDKTSGDIITDGDESHPYDTNLENYLAHLKKWEFALEYCAVDMNYTKSSGSIQEYARRLYSNPDIDLGKVKHKVNRSQKAVSFTVHIHLMDEDIVQKVFGPLIFLPKTSLDEKASINIVLRDIIGMPIEQQAPSWLQDYTLPGQLDIDEQILFFESQILELQAKKEHKIQERLAIREPLKVLYEMDEPLERSIWELLEKLGAKVERPLKVTGNNQEDGWITVEVDGMTYEGVLEIKGTKKPGFNEDGLKQLGIWKTNGQIDRDKEYKGIFIGNSRIEEAPSIRPDPFNPNWRSKAQKTQVVAITTNELLKVI